MICLSLSLLSAVLCKLVDCYIPLLFCYGFKYCGVLPSFGSLVASAKGTLEGLLFYAIRRKFMPLLKKSCNMSSFSWTHGENATIFWSAIFVFFIALMSVISSAFYLVLQVMELALSNCWLRSKKAIASKFFWIIWIQNWRVFSRIFVREEHSHWEF